MPVIVAPATSECVPLRKDKFLVPNDLTVGQFVYSLYQQMEGDTPALNTMLKLYVNSATHHQHQQLQPSECMAAVHATHFDVDGFLYLHYCTWPRED